MRKVRRYLFGDGVRLSKRLMRDIKIPIRSPWKNMMLLNAYIASKMGKKIIDGISRLRRQ